MKSEFGGNLNMATSLSKIFATNVRARRKAIKLSQQELADAANIDRTYASQIERAIANPSLLVVESIAKALNTQPVDLLK